MLWERCAPLWTRAAAESLYDKCYSSGRLPASWAQSVAPCRAMRPHWTRRSLQVVWSVEEWTCSRVLRAGWTTLCTCETHWTRCSREWSSSSSSTRARGGGRRRSRDTVRNYYLHYLWRHQLGVEWLLAAVRSVWQWGRHRGTVGAGGCIARRMVLRMEGAASRPPSDRGRRPRRCASSARADSDSILSTTHGQSLSIVRIDQLWLLINLGLGWGFIEKLLKLAVIIILI